jgi:tRNA threonylcarbamoyl adenosine modification protein (Sua5/YciO/YrdC/YwlC family)
MLIKLYPENPAPRQLELVIDILKKDGVIIYPTDTVYAIGCDMKSQQAIERVCQIIGKKPENANLSLICYDLSNIAEYTVPFSNSIFKMMKSCLPGPYTFILNANHNVPKLFKNKKKTIGIRVPDNNIPREIVRMLGNPIITASIHQDNDFEYYSDPELIYEDFGSKVELVIDGGMGDIEASTIIDCTGNEMELVRQGKGIVDIMAE